MKKIIILLLFALISNAILAQITFEKSISYKSGKLKGSPVSCEVTDIKQTSDNGYIILGEMTDSLYTFADILLIKTDVNGDTLWLKTYGGNNLDTAHSVEQTADGGYFVTGSTKSFGAGNYDVYVIKTDSLGDVMWSKTIGGIADDIGNSGEQTNDGGYIVTGTTNSFGAGSGDIYLVKLNTIGDTLWTKTYGGSGGDAAYCVRQTNDGGYILTGEKGLRDSSSIEHTAMYLLKTNGSGDTLWSKEYYLGSDTAITWGLQDTVGIGYSVQLTSDGGYIIAGYMADDYNNFTAVYIKTNNVGNVLWAKKVQEDDYTGGFTARQTSDGGYIFLGYNAFAPNFNLMITKTDSMGTVIWNKFPYYINVYNHYLSPYDIIQTNDGGFAFACQMLYWGGVRSPNFFKLNADCNTSCNYTFGNFNPYIFSTQLLTNSLPTQVSFGGTITNPNTFVKRPGGLDTTYCFSTGISEIKNIESSITISPNPFSTQTTIAFYSESRTSGTGNHTIKVVNVLGETIQQLTTNNKQLTLDMSNVAKGVYFVRIEDEKKNVVNRKIVVQ